jgi:hypothetical protein
MAQEEITIRISAIDAATEKINGIAKSLSQLQVNLPKIDLKGMDLKEVDKIKVSVKGLGKELIQIDPIIGDLAKGFGQLQTPIVQIGDYFNQFNEALGISGLSTKQFTNWMDQNFMAFTRQGTIIDKLTKQHYTYGQAVKLATIQHRRFKFEYLSIMFAGMALDRAFGGLVKSQLTLFGVTDMLSTAWTIVLLPIMELITPIIYTLLDAFMNLPEGIKLAIGGFVLFFAIAGKIMLVVGQVVLAVMGLMMVFSGWGGILFLLVGGVLAAFIASLFKSQDAMDNLKNKVTAFGISGEMFDKIKDKLVSFFEIIKKYAPIVWDKFKEYFKIAFDYVVEIVKTKIPAFIDALSEFLNKAINYIVENLPRFIEEGWKILSSIIDGIINNVDKISEAITKIIDGIGTFLKENTPKIVNFGIKILDTILTGIINNADEIGNALEEVLTALGKWIGQNAIPLIKLGIKFAYYIAKGVAQGLKELIGGLFESITGIKISGKKISWKMPSFQTGGYVPETGLALLHKGEYVTPRNETGTQTVIFSPTANINANVSSSYDVRELANELNSYWARDFERLLKTRGSI